MPAVFLLLPAAQGGLTLSFGVYASMIHAQMMGLTELLPYAHSDELSAALAIALTAALCSIAHYAETATSGTVHLFNPPGTTFAAVQTSRCMTSSDCMCTCIRVQRDSITFASVQIACLLAVAIAA